VSIGKILSISAEITGDEANRRTDCSSVGAIGVSGGPNGAADDICAAAGIAAIEDDISL